MEPTPRRVLAKATKRRITLRILMMGVSCQLERLRMRPMAHARKTGETSGRKTTEVSALQSSKAHLPKSVTVRGNVREVIPLQLSNAYSSMLVSVLGKLTSFRKLQR